MAPFTSVASARRRAATAALVLAGAGVLSACDGGAALRTDNDTPQPTVLVVSSSYSGQDGGVDKAATLRRVLDDLRAGTGSGWVGRQDDVTGYLGELTGGRYFADAGADSRTVVRSFMDTWGIDLFGVGSAELVLEKESEPTVAGSTTIRSTQRVNDVPVLDGTLIFTIGDAAAQPRLNAVRGRAFSGLRVDTDPTLSAHRATGRAERVSGGHALGRPHLVVVPDGEGVLAWQVTVTAADDADAVAPQDGHYFIDADSGAVVAVRAASAEGVTPMRLLGARGVPAGRTVAATPVPPLPADPRSVEVTGHGPNGQQLTGQGVRTDQGVVLVDTTVPTYDPATGRGGIETFDARGGDDDAALPGQRYVEQAGDGTTITDPDAIAAHAFSRAVYDYYAQLGRASWDGKGSSLVSSVHYGDNSFCNAFFNGTQMVYGNPCAPDGDPVMPTMLDIDVAAHEITHGVTDSTSGLIYSGQPGALNESFSDYFGNVIGNLVKGTDNAALAETACEGITSETRMCHPNPEGTFSTRFLLNGNSFEDYLYLLDPPYRLFARGFDQDNGGVHLNSAIWNNALWSIRSRLAQMDGASGNDSELAGDFDKIVYAALTTQLGPTSGFLDARRAIEQITVDAGADPVILRVAREIFDDNRICADCSETGAVPGEVVSRAIDTELMPAVHGEQIAWLSKREGPFGAVTTSKVGATPAGVGSSVESIQVVFAADAMVGLEYPEGRIPGKVVRYLPGGEATELGQAGMSTLEAGLAGSDAGAAWVTTENGTVSYVDADGNVTTAELPAGAGAVTAVGTGDGTVSLGTESGQVLLWTPGQGFEELGSTEAAVLSVASYGQRAIAVDEEYTAVLMTPSRSTVLSEKAVPLGTAMNADYAVWTNYVGMLGGGVAEGRKLQVPDTDLHLVSFGTGTVYNLAQSRGQQGFPALSGNRLVWQDSVFGGDDIMTATIPSGL